MLTLNRHELQNALRVLGKCASRHSHIPALQCVLIDASDDGFMLSATDLEVGATLCVPAAAGRQDRARVFLNVAQLAGLVNTIKEDEIAMGVEGDTLVVGRARLRTGMSADDYPVIPRPPEYPAGVYEPGPGFAEALAFCAAAVSGEITRYPLTGLYLDFPRGALVASDGKRLHYAVIGEPKAVPPQIVPARIFTAITPDRIIVPRPEQDKEGNEQPPTQVFFSFPNGTAYSRIVEGNFPEYDQVVPAKCSSCFTTERAALLEGLHQILPLASKRQPTCRIEANGALDLSVKNADDGTEASVQVGGTLKGREVAVTVNPHLLWDLIEGIPGAVLRVCFQDAQSAMLVEDPESSWFGLIMPLRTAETAEVKEDAA